jgi:hypothetical protein
MSVLLRPGNGFEPNMERIPGVLAACPARELTPRRPSFGAALADLAASTPPPRQASPIRFYSSTLRVALVALAQHR